MPCACIIKILYIQINNILYMSLLADPQQTRILKQLPRPYSKSVKLQQLFQNRQINIQLLVNFLSYEGILDVEIVKKIIKLSSQILRMEPNLIYINDPVLIVGDVHGQYYDLVQILKTNFDFHNPSSLDKKFLFLGDYVDRGLFSIQVLLLILALKINFPRSFILLRGNHESKQLTSFFNFKNQCLQFYNQDVYTMFTDLFNLIPLAAIVNKKFLCLHGGISTNLTTIQDIMRINRFTQIPQNGLFCDLVWADPIQNSEGQLKGLVSYNETRGCSYYFGYNLTKNFLRKNNLRCIIRAHQAKQLGYQIHSWAGKQCFPPVITVFSAPNYCDFYNNKGAVINLKVIIQQFESNTMQVIQINGKQHPYYLPNNLSLFQWTIPFVAQKVTQMFYHLLKPDAEIKQQQIIVQLIDRQRIIEQLLKLQNEDVQQKMEIVKYQGKVLGEQLMVIDKAREYVLNVNQKNFDTERIIDQINEKRPMQTQASIQE